MCRGAAPSSKDEAVVGEKRMLLRNLIPTGAITNSLYLFIFNIFKYIELT